MKKAVVVVGIILGLLGIIGSCGDDYDANDLQAAKNRYASGKYTREDEIMVEGFYKWKADQDRYIDN